MKQRKCRCGNVTNRMTCSPCMAQIIATNEQDRLHPVKAVPKDRHSYDSTGKNFNRFDPENLLIRKQRKEQNMLKH